MRTLLTLSTLGLLTGLLAGPSAGQDDPRNVRAGWVLPDEGYCDQPLVARLADGTWLTVLTTGAGHEGQRGQQERHDGEAPALRPALLG